MTNGFFRYFDEASRARLLSAAHLVEAAAGDVIFREGEKPDAVYLVADGVINLTGGMSPEQNVPIAEVTRDGFFGEFGVIDGNPRSATATAQTRVSLLRLDCEHVLDALGGADAAAVQMAAMITRKTRDTTQKYVHDLLMRERLAMVGRMLNSILHDMRNPLSVVGMCAELISMYDVEEPVLENCALIREQLERIQRMAEDVLDFTGNRTTVTTVETDIAALLARFDHLNRTYIEKQSITLLIEARPRIVLADEDRLLRVLQNLVYNAAEAVGAKGAISIRQEDREHEVILHVADNGPGLPEAIRGRLFEAFATHGKRKGLGLGLAIAKSIVERHGGNLTFTTTSGKGTTFHVTLPAETATPAS